MAFQYRLFLIPALFLGCSSKTVMTENGPIQGAHVEMNLSLNAPIPQPVDVYLGIPFAQPPVGNFRFRPPQPIITKWVEPLLATSQPPSCSTGDQEDCLYLNVFAPSTPSTQPRAVLMWIYGGGFAHGSVSKYDATSMSSSEDVIVVMGNYRSGMLGFLSSDETMAESGTTGNWAMLDQIAVMKWINRNIAAFNGDPSKVTIFGESAGAMSVVAHLVSPMSSGLFSAAIIQSGTTNVEIFFQNRNDAQKYNEWFAKVHLDCPLGLADLECLRRAPASQFNRADDERDGWGAPTWGNPIFPLFMSAPVIDGVFLQDSPYKMAKSGKFSNQA